MTNKIAVAAAVLLAAATATGCGETTAGRPPPDNPATTVDEHAAGLMEHHRYHHHGGVTMFVAMSLDTLAVPSEEQATVQKIRAELRAAMEPARQADAQLLTTLADALVAPTFDAVAVDSAVARVVGASAAAQEAGAQALNQLHAALTPPERAALADKVESHWAVWQQENAGLDAPATTPGSGHLQTLTAALGLSADQATKIRAALADEKPGVRSSLDQPAMAQHLRTFGAAFRDPTFDARTLPGGDGANPHLVGWGAAHLARVVEVMSPVLTVEQRGTFAQLLREHAAHDPGAEGNS